MNTLVVIAICLVLGYLAIVILPVLFKLFACLCIGLAIVWAVGKFFQPKP